jgi:hypothetical protein
MISGGVGHVGGLHRTRGVRLHPASAGLNLPAGKSPRTSRAVVEWSVEVAISMRTGTRKSSMAPAQTEAIARRLSAAAADRDVEIVIARTRPER